MNRACRNAGFTMIEFMMVAGISAVIIVGLSAVIEVPRMVMEQRSTSQSASSIDRVLSVLDRDIRFCRDARTPDAATLEIDGADGSLIVYRGPALPGGAVTREDGNGLVEIARGIEACQFGLRTHVKSVTAGIALDVDETVTETASFDNYEVQPGFVVGLVRPLAGMLGLTLQTNIFGISHQRRPGFWFRAQGLAGDNGFAASFRTRLRRFGTGDLEIRIYQAFGDDSEQDGVGPQKRPDRLSLVAIGLVPNASLPASFAEVTVPLTSVRKLSNTAPYFVEMQSDRAAFAAELEVYTANPPEGVGASNGGLIRSIDFGGNFASFTGNIRSSQARFSLQAVRTTTNLAELPPSPVQHVDVVVGVELELSFRGATGTEAIHAAFPIQNNLLDLR